MTTTDEVLRSLPEPGQLVQVRARRHLVEDVEPVADGEDQTVVHFSCLDDDRATLTEDEEHAEEDVQMAAATRDSLSDASAASFELLDAVWINPPHEPRDDASRDAAEPGSESGR